MAQKPEDLNLPAAVIARLIKEALPDGVLVSKEARSAISKSASVFILFATASANGFAEQAKRRTLNANDIFSGLEEMQLENYVEPLKAFLKEYKDKSNKKKSISKEIEKPTPQSAKWDDEQSADILDDTASSSKDSASDVVILD